MVALLKHRLSIILSLVTLVTFINCYRDRVTNPRATYEDGTVWFVNQSSDVVFFSEYRQIRHWQSTYTTQNVFVQPGGKAVLHNILDSGYSESFPGGDRIEADYSGPQAGNLPIWSGTAKLVVDGNMSIIINIDGSYTVGHR